MVDSRTTHLFVFCSTYLSSVHVRDRSASAESSYQNQILEVTTVAEASSPAMPVRDVAAYLNVNEKTVYRLAQRGELPGFKVAGAWRFQRSDLDHWIKTQKQAASRARDLPPQPTRKVQGNRANGSSATTGGAR